MSIDASKLTDMADCMLNRTFTLARRACRLYRGGYASKQVRHHNVRAYIASVQMLGSRWLLAAPINKESK